MSEIQYKRKREDDENEFPIDKKEEINDGEVVAGHDDNIIDNEEIEEHDDEDYESIENVEVNQKEQTRIIGNKNDEVDVDFLNDDDDVHDYTNDFNDNDKNDCRVQQAIRTEE